MCERERGIGKRYKVTENISTNSAVATVRLIKIDYAAVLQTVASQDLSLFRCSWGKDAEAQTLSPKNEGSLMFGLAVTVWKKSTILALSVPK